MPRLTQLIAAILLLPALAACGRGESAAIQRIGSAQHGAHLIAQLGCGSCHEIPGVANAAGRVGPPLGNVGARSIIAGVLPNTPDNLVRWLRVPQSVVPGNAMPDMELNEHDARDVAAYLYTLR